MKKSCWICKHLKYEEGTPWYSELTPGIDPYIYCNKGHNLFKFYSEDAKQRAGEIARKCKDFEVEKD